MMDAIWTTSSEQVDRLFDEGWHLKDVKLGYGYISYLMVKYDK